VPFEKGVLAFENQVLSFDKGVLAFVKGVLALPCPCKYSTTYILNKNYG
jgi:hypothetical protein